MQTTDYTDNTDKQGTEEVPALSPETLFSAFNQKAVFIRVIRVIRGWVHYAG